MTQITVTISASIDASKLPALLALLAGTEPQVAIEAPAEAPKKRTKKAEEPVAAPAPEPVKQPEPAPAKVTEVTLDPAKNTAPVPTIEQLREAAIAANSVIGQDGLVRLVKEYGKADKLSAVPEANRLSLLKALLSSASVG